MVSEPKKNIISGKKRIAVLGSTGSIGTQTLDVIGEYPDRFVPTMLVAGTKVDTLIQQAIRWRPEMALIADERQYWKLRDALEPLGITTAAGQQAMEELMGELLEAAARQTEMLEEVLQRLERYNSDT